MQVGRDAKNMQPADRKTLVTLRLLVGFLGERDQFSWWQSSFFAPGSGSFLAPVFPRTQFVAQFQSVTRAALLQHDDRIGIGDVFHLFRLPEEIEQGVHRVVQDSNFSDWASTLIPNRDTAISNLRKIASLSSESSVGPICVGGLQDARNPAIWGTAAAFYAQAFCQGTRAYPFFSDRR